MDTLLVEQGLDPSEYRRVAELYSFGTNKKLLPAIIGISADECMQPLINLYLQPGLVDNTETQSAFVRKSQQYLSA